MNIFSISERAVFSLPVANDTKRLHMTLHPVFLIRALICFPTVTFEPIWLAQSSTAITLAA